MVQQRQLHHSHIDSHYAACVFRYIREYAIICRDFCNFICLDDKHRVKVGEPEVPVAAVERGRQVLVSKNERMVVADHDFTKFSLIPSVIFQVNIPEEIKETWYTGQVYIGFKDAVLEPSSSIRHATELYSVLSSTSTSTLPVLFLYTDGGPDHRLTYISVQISLICFFKKLDLDFLCAARQAAYQSWRNPVERLMSIINLGLQSVGIARSSVGINVEVELKKCNSMSQLRKVAERVTTIIGIVQDSLSPVKILLNSIMTRLMLKETPFQTYTSATVPEIEEFWMSILELESTLTITEKLNKNNVDKYHNLCAFIQHCCSSSHYSFDILKCGSAECQFCSKPRLPMDVLVTLQHLPHPTPGKDNHYKMFSEVYGTKTSEEHQPSLSAKNPKKLSLLLQVFNMLKTLISWSCVMSARCGAYQVKLYKEQREYLQSQLEHYSFTCGSDLSNMENTLQNFPFCVCRSLHCFDLIERLYYSAGYAPICIYCANDVSTNPGTHYTQLQSCIDKNCTLVKKKT